MTPDPTFPPGWTNLALTEVDSTNAEALRQLAHDPPLPLWITSPSQTAGRGRSGRSWSTESGNLAASLLFTPRCNIARLPELALVAGLAVHDTVRALLPRLDPASLRIKWPNDVLIDGAKVSGILIESTTLGGATLAVIGIGINLVTAPDIQGRRMTALAYRPDFSGSFEQASLILAGRLAARLDQWADGSGFGAIREAWLARSGPIGAVMRINAVGSPVEGRFAGIDEHGALLLQMPDGKQRTFTYGDVSLVPGG